MQTVSGRIRPGTRGRRTWPLEDGTHMETTRGVVVRCGGGGEDGGMDRDAMSLPCDGRRLTRLRDGRLRQLAERTSERTAVKRLGRLLEGRLSMQCYASNLDWSVGGSTHVHSRTEATYEGSGREKRSRYWFHSVDGGSAHRDARIL
jgi:hypothetical protein